MNDVKQFGLRYLHALAGMSLQGMLFGMRPVIGDGTKPGPTKRGHVQCREPTGYSRRVGKTYCIKGLRP